MKKEVKRGLLSVAVLPLFALMLTCFGAAADESALTVNIVGESCVITDCDVKAEGVLEIPSHIEGRPVTVIDKGAFSKCKLLTELVIPDTVAEIGKNAFMACAALKSVKMTDSVTRLGEGVFYQCSSLESVALTGKLTTIPKETFYMCTSLESVTLPHKLSVIGQNAFFGCSSLEKIVLPEGVTELCARCFSNCTSLGAIFIPASTEIINADAFEKCDGLNFVYYAGSKEDFEAIDLYSGNSSLEYAEQIFNHDHIKASTVTVIDATCVQPGYSIFSCTCGYEGTGAPQPAKGHSLTVIKTVTEPDCVSEGVVRHQCDSCDYYEEETLPATGHNIVTDKASQATCTSKGKTEGKHCSLCGTVTVKQEDIPALSHSFTVAVKDSKHLASQATYLNASRYYYDCSRCGKMSDKDTFSGEKLTLSNVKKLSFESTTSTVTLSWSKVSSARGYAVYQKDSAGNWSFIKRVRKNSIKLTDLPYGKTVIYGVKAYVLEEDTLVYSSAYTSVKAATKPLPTSKITAKQNDKAITLSWKKARGATGYRVYKYDSKNKKWSIICSYTKNNKLTVKSLKSGYRYKFSVRSCIDTGNERVWSKMADGLTTCTKPQSPTLKATSYKYAVKLSWNKIKYADGYTVYVSEKPESGYKKVKTTKKLNYKIENLKSGKYYYFKVYSYRKLSDGKVYSYASQIKKVKTR
ncbi:MAG: hypothetical protein E7538_01480 [Ruminococcaceae bacterium]|nr:hypothetical protein [Oscillospiraceae bacterium]